MWLDCDNGDWMDYWCGNVCGPAKGVRNPRNGGIPDPNWNAMYAGEFGVGEYTGLNDYGCCGDDLNERTIQTKVNGVPQGSYACCNSAFDCVTPNGECVSVWSADSTDIYFCSSGNNLLECGPSNECVNPSGSWKCFNTGSGWEWRAFGGPSETTSALCSDTWDNDCSNGPDCVNPDPNCQTWGHCNEICGNGLDDDNDEMIDYCDPDCTCPIGSQEFTCTSCVQVTANPYNVITGQDSTITATIRAGTPNPVGSCQLFSGYMGFGMSYATCDINKVEVFGYPVDGDYTPYFQDSDNQLMDRVYANNDVRVRPACAPLKTHGNIFAECYDWETMSEPVYAHADSNYHCPPGLECYVCDLGFVWSEVHGQCTENPCQGDGCTQDGVGSWESLTTPLGYCPTQPDICVDCKTGDPSGTWDVYCLSCWETCPDGIQGGSFSGCITNTPNNAVQVSSGGVCMLGGYACTNTLAGDPPPPANICWRCDSGYHWDTGAKNCVADCGVSGDSCTGMVMGECCTGTVPPHYCSQHGRGGDPIIPSTEFHCCEEGDYWDTSLGQCRNEDICIGPTLCQTLSDFPFNPPGGWWDVAVCIDQTNACCYTTIYNPSCDDPADPICYHYLWNEAY